MKRIFYASTMILIWIFLTARIVAADDPVAVSWPALLANPGKYDGKLVHLSGWLTVYLIGNSAVFRLYSCHEAMSFSDVTQGIDVEPESMASKLPEPRETWQYFNHERVLLIGVFHAGKEGVYPPTFAGSIDKIETLQQKKPGSVQFR
jgi:hypothetical protein